MTTATDLILPNLTSPAESPDSKLTVRALFRSYRWRILATYVMFNLENVIRLAQPLVLGWAINDLLKDSYQGLWIFVVQHVAHLFLSAARRTYDTRAFTSIYTDLASELVHKQRKNGVATSIVAARSALSRELVDFFERDIPGVLFTVYSVIGALVMLPFYDWVLVPLCLGLLLPLGLINVFYGRHTLFLTGRLNDRLEREVEVIERAETRKPWRHFDLLARWRIKLSDCEALNFGLMETFVLGLMAVALIRSCKTADADAGSIFAIFRYVLMFVMGLDGVPMLVQQFSRLRDIGGRVNQ